MVTTRHGVASPRLSSVKQEVAQELQVTAEGADNGAAAASRPSRLARGGSVPAAGTHTFLLQRAAFLTLTCYLVWFTLIGSGILAYEGEPILVKSRDLPLHWFDKLFRTAGSLLLFCLWSVRAGAVRLLPAHFDRRATLLWVPAIIYAGQAVVRMVIYQLHVAGYIFTPQRWARDNQTHPPHVMSDHILLASAVHGGLASEALLPLLNWWHVEATGRGRTFLRVYSAAAGCLAVMVSAECYFTARYFHPPGEIILAAAIGLALFQAPLLWYAARAFQQHHMHTQASAAAGGRHSRPRKQ